MEEKFYFMFYHNGCQFRLPVLGEDRFVRERAFLDDLIGRTPQHKSFNRPVPEALPRITPDDDDQFEIELVDRIIAAQDFYPLDDAQFDAFTTFRRQMDREFGPQAL